MVRNWSGLIDAFDAFRSPLRLEALEETYILTDDSLRDQMYSRRFASHPQALLKFMCSWQKEYARTCFLWTYELSRLYLGDSRILPAHTTANTFLLSTSFKALRFAFIYGIRFAPIRLAPFVFFSIRTAPYMNSKNLPAKLVLEWWNKASHFKYLRFYTLPTYFTAFNCIVMSTTTSHLLDYLIVGNSMIKSPQTSLIFTAASEKSNLMQIPLEPMPGLSASSSLVKPYQNRDIRLLMSSLCSTPVSSLKDLYVIFNLLTLNTILM